MGLYETLTYITDSITERGKLINMTREDMKELLQLYVNKTVVSPFADARDPLHFIEAFPRNGLQAPHKLPRFSSSEQRRRSAQSAAVRSMMVEHLIESATRLEPYKKHGEDYSRDAQRLFRSPIPGVPLSEKEQARIKADNEEVAFLFNTKTNWRSYARMQARVLNFDLPEADAFRKKHGIAADQPLTEDVIFQAYARRRGEITMERYRESVEIAKNAEQAFDPSLSPEELAVNFWKIKEASHFLVEFRATIKEAENPNLTRTFTDAELKEIGDASQYENLAGVAICRFNLIANPLYSILDLDTMEDYDFTSNGISANYEGVNEENALPGNQTVPIHDYDARKLEQDVIDEYIENHSDKYTLAELHTFFDKPTLDTDGKTWKTSPPANGHVHSDFYSYVSDFEFYYNNKIMPIADKADEYLKLFGLPVRVSSKYAGQTERVRFYSEQNTSDSLKFTSETGEVDSTDLLAQGIPVAYQLNGRTIILSKNADGKASTDNLTFEKPEALFNAGLRRQQQTFTSQLDAADSMFVRSSPEFKAMKSSLEDISKMGELKPGEDVAEATARFRKLLEDTEKYLIYKKDADMLETAGQGEEPVDDDDRSSYEQERLNAARRIRAFAQAKLKELDLIRQARVTMRDFTREQNGSLIPVDEQTRNHLIARSDMSAQLNAQIRDAQAQAQPAVEEPQPAVEPVQEQPKVNDPQPEVPVNEQPLPEPVEVKEEAPVQAQEEVPVQAQPADEEQKPDVPVDEQPIAEPEVNLNLDDDDAEWELKDDFLNMDQEQLDKWDAELHDKLDSDPEVNDIHLEFDDEDDLVAEVDRQYDNPDTSVASFVHTHITNDLKSHFVEGTPFSTAECRFLLSSALLYHTLCRESEEHTAETAGSLTDMLKNHPDIFTFMHLKLQQSYTVNAFLQAIPEGSTISMAAMNLLLEQAKNTPVDSVDLSADVLTSEQCTDLLTNEILNDMLRQERAANQTGQPGALETMLSSDREHTELLADCIRRSDAMKEMISKASVNGQVSFSAISALLKQIKEPDFLSEKSFFQTYDVNKLMSEYMFDRVTALKKDKDNSLQPLGEQMADLSYTHRSNILSELQRSSLMDTMAENAGLKDKGMHSLNDLTKLLGQIPTAETILNTPVLSETPCSVALANDALDRMVDLEKKRLRGQPELKNASTCPLERLMRISPDVRDKLINNLATGSLLTQIYAEEPNFEAGKISLSSMLTLIKNMDNKEYLSNAYDENVLDQNMCGELLSDYMLDSMIEMHRSTHKGKAGLLENLKVNDPVSYKKLRSKLAETDDVRGVVAPEIDELSEKLSLSKMGDLFPEVRGANFCKCAVDKAIAAIKKENQKNNPQKQKDLEKNQVKEQKPVMPRG